jgi:hypothetical protein
MSRPVRLSQSDSGSELRVVRGGGWKPAVEEEGMELGCIMLSRIRWRFKKPNMSTTMRCSLGYALKSNDDVCRCMEATGPGSCWKKEQDWRVVDEEPVSRG